MKNLILLLLFSSGLAAHAHTLPEYTTPANPDTNQYQLFITIEQEGLWQQVQLDFETEDELMDFDSFAFAEDLFITDAGNSICTVSVTVKVRIGVGSNFVEVSATVSGIACSEVVSTVKRLRQELRDAIK